MMLRRMAANRKNVRPKHGPARGTRAERDLRHDVVAIGSSAGGLRSLTEVLRVLPTDFPCSILVVQHLDPRKKSLMADLLNRVTNIRVKQAEHGEALLPGVAYIAPPDEHMLAGPGKIQLAHSQLIHFLRPSVDLLFESVAGTYGSRCIGVVLSGSLRDGAAGVRAIKQAGGTTVVEDPQHAEFSSMPRAAIGTSCVDHVAPLERLGPLLEKLCYGASVADEEQNVTPGSVA
jgi:two-component system, chemotaxis family, protein-glutamate methylesterase/glutaminase